MPKRIAFLTFGIMKSPMGSPEVQGFFDRIGDVYAAADGAAGFYERSIRNVETWEHSWGPVIAPKFTPRGIDLNQIAMTLSLWRDLESVAAFAYRGAHGDALSRRTDRFRKPEYPPYVAWWVDESHRPNWSEAVVRIEKLHERGPTPDAFSFRKPFDAAGAAARMKMEHAASR